MRNIYINCHSNRLQIELMLNIKILYYNKLLPQTWVVIIIFSQSFLLRPV